MAIRSGRVFFLLLLLLINLLLLLIYIYLLYQTLNFKLLLSGNCMNGMFIMDFNLCLNTC